MRVQSRKKQGRYEVSAFGGMISRNVMKYETETVVMLRSMEMVIVQQGSLHLEPRRNISSYLRRHGPTLRTTINAPVAV